MEHSNRLSRKGRGELVGGGFFVFRRGRKSRRVKFDPKTCIPFEHGTEQSARDEAEKLAAANLGSTYCIFVQMGAVKI